MSSSSDCHQDHLKIIVIVIIVIIIIIIMPLLLVAYTVVTILDFVSLLFFSLSFWSSTFINMSCGHFLSTHLHTFVLNIAVGMRSSSADSPCPSPLGSLRACCRCRYTFLHANTDLLHTDSELPGDIEQNMVKLKVIYDMMQEDYESS